ncbi:hypothetical protein AB0945_16245, partial [Streptomyces sp. NPDC005474]|uniref:hypothetical protein n=1 Tax=Streptomyces sp. NPDC005474 TaxID=3154878 RepID=UPI003451BFED
WTRFKNLKVQDLEGDELLYRELRDRFGTYFDEVCPTRVFDRGADGVPVIASQDSCQTCFQC